MKKKQIKTGFNRNARDQLRRQPKGVTSSDDKVMLIGDSRSDFVLIEPTSMRLVLRIKRNSILRPDIRLGARVTHISWCTNPSEAAQ